MNELSLIYKEGDLFKPSRNFRFNACVGKNGGPYNFFAYSKGYFEACERLIDSINKNKRLIDILVYPIIFNFRHALELSLKHFIPILYCMFDVGENIKQSHNLEIYWKEAKKYIVKLLNDDETILNVIKYLDSIIKDIYKYDPIGESFRFPKSKKGKLLLEELRIINVKELSEIVKKTSEIFDILFYAIGERWEYFAEEKYYEQQLNKYYENI
jgi:hypothetical protein